MFLQLVDEYESLFWLINSNEYKNLEEPNTGCAINYQEIGIYACNTYA